MHVFLYFNEGIVMKEKPSLIMILYFIRQGMLVQFMVLTAQ